MDSQANDPVLKPAKRKIAPYTRLKKSERDQIINLRTKKELSITAIGKIINRDPMTVYRTLIQADLMGDNHKFLKENWKDATFIDSAHIRSAKRRFIQKLNELPEETIANVPALENARIVKELSIAEGASNDQAPKFQVNIQVNLTDSDRAISLMEQELESLKQKLLTGKDESQLNQDVIDISS